MYADLAASLLAFKFNWLSGTEIMTVAIAAKVPLFTANAVLKCLMYTSISLTPDIDFATADRKLKCAASKLDAFVAKPRM